MRKRESGPCSATRIAFAPGGKCLQGYRLTPADVVTETGHNPCNTALDVVSATTRRLSIEAGSLGPQGALATAQFQPRWNDPDPNPGSIRAARGRAVLSCIDSRALAPLWRKQGACLLFLLPSGAIGPRFTQP